MDKILIDELVSHAEGKRWMSSAVARRFTWAMDDDPTEVPVPQSPPVPLPGEEHTVGDPLPPVPPPPYVTPEPEPEPEPGPGPRAAPAAGASERAGWTE